MPYADRETQKEYQRQYYLKYLKKSIPKKKRIDLSQGGSRPSKGLINDVRTNCINKPLKQSYNSGKDFTPVEASTDSDEDPAPKRHSPVSLSPRRQIHRAQSIIRDNYNLDDDDDEPTAPKLSRRHQITLDDRNPFLLKLTDENAFNQHIHNEIPNWIRNMTANSLRAKIEELGNIVGEDRLDRAIDYWNALFGDHKTLRKLQYAYKYLLDITRDR